MHSICVLPQSLLIPAVDKLHSLQWPATNTPNEYAMISNEGIPGELALTIRLIIAYVLALRPFHTLGEVHLSRLTSRQRIPLHSDALGADTLRIHVPLITNPKAIFSQPPEAPYHMQYGLVYELEPVCMHSVTNAGEEDRIHLMWDIRRESSRSS